MKLRAGDLVEVKSKDEILATLDEQGALDQLPFMPEMLQYCGKQLKVFKRAHKTCDTIEYTGSRWMKNAVHLEGVRCDGSSHGGCQAGCLMFWKESWLRQAGVNPETLEFGGKERSPHSCTQEALAKATRRSDNSSESSQNETFSCQTTELLRATSVLHWWDVRQYVEDVWSGNATIGQVVKTFLFWIFTKTLRITAHKLQLRTYNKIQSMRGGTPYPFFEGALEQKTPSETLSLKPGEYVQVKPLDEIILTINKRNRNRGLSFDCEMVKYCGGKFKVLQRVEQIIDEKTGRMMKLPNDCVSLDNVFCAGEYSRKRYLCPRSIYSFWREIWLTRVER